MTNDDATIYNGFVEILPDCAHFYLVDMKLDAMPEIVDGQFILMVPVQLGTHTHKGENGNLRRSNLCLPNWKHKKI